MDLSQTGRGPKDRRGLKNQLKNIVAYYKVTKFSSMFYFSYLTVLGFILSVGCILKEFLCVVGARE